MLTLNREECRALLTQADDILAGNDTTRIIRAAGALAALVQYLLTEAEPSSALPQQEPPPGH